jgi:type II secretory pathway predicted ATPase ExeA
MSNASGANVVSQMLEFYGLREHPFGVSPDPRFLYPSAQHREAMASLIFGIESQVGFAALIAEPGSGKTTLLFDLLARYRERAHTAFVYNTVCSGMELLRQVILELEVPGTEQETDPVRLHHLFTAFVASRMASKPVIIIIDEAQNLENSALETLRLLSNFEAADRKLLHIILAGQPQLADKLRHPSLTQLLQRIAMVSQLQRFNREQIAECIAFRLRVAGHQGGELFSEQAMSLITAASGGVPREINRIGMNAMQLGYVLKEKTIGVAVVEEVLSDLTLARWAPMPEALPSAPDAQPPYSASGVFRVGGQSGVRPRPPADPWAARVQEYARSHQLQPSNDDVDPLLHLRNQPSLRYAQPMAENIGPMAPSDDADPLRPGNDGGVRRALLDAAVRRRRAAELRLMGLQREEGAAPADGPAAYPYKFAMGCMPNPSPAERSSTPDDDERLRSRSGVVAEAAERLEAARQEEREKRESKDKKTG